MILKKEGHYVAYLRKSRADRDLEKTTGVDTLKRHRDILNNLANSLEITVDKWFEEIVSGETIAARPEIQKMLFEIEKELWDGVLVVDVDRLARGDNADQSRILKSFSFSSTLIITPGKIYDPNNEADEDFFEFGLFMSRREYKIINKRLNRGRISSVNEGKYIGSICPYGYTKEKIIGQKGYKLIPLEEEAKVVQIIFEKACSGIGSQNIANYLNNLGITPRKNNEWSYSTIITIIQNPVYYGMIKWNQRKTEKKMTNGIIYKSRPRHKDYLLVKGLHEAIISKEVYDMANQLRTQKVKKSVRNDRIIQNPLMGLVRCSICGRTMQRRNYRSGKVDGLICPRPHCKNVGSHLYLVEQEIINSLKTILKEYMDVIEQYNNEETKEQITDNTLEIIDTEIVKLKQQLNKAYDLLEQEIYDNQTFIERSTLLKEQLTSLEKEKAKHIPSSNKISKIKNAIPNIKRVIELYDSTITPQEKNDLLGSIIDSIDYLKLKKGKGHENEFTLKIKIKL